LYPGVVKEDQVEEERAGRLVGAVEEPRDGVEGDAVY
jgi:hypothetical protein